MQTFNTTSSLFIQVEDNGVGIHADQQGAVFGMFNRFHPSTISGSGLGLYIVKKQVDRLGAEITFESTPKGTTFYIEFAFAPKA